MRTTLLLFTLVLLSYVSRAQWVQQTSNTTNDLWSVFFTDNSTGFASSDFNLSNTTNGGTTWNPTFSTGPNRSIQFLNATVGFGIGNSVDILKTVDGGQTWTTSYNNVNTLLLAVHFPSPLIGYAVGADASFMAGEMYKTVNGGTTWTAVSHPAPDVIYDLYFTSNDTGYIVGYSFSGDFIFKTVNGGASWQTQTPSGNSIINSIYCRNSDNCWCAGTTNGQISRTTNGGTNWTTCTNSQTNPLYDIVFVNSTIGYAVGGNGISSGTIVRSIDGGLTWTLSTSSVNTFQSVHFPSVNIGYAVGTGGAIYKYDALTSLNEMTSTITFNLFPNPSSGIIQIEAQFPNGKLEIYNSLGEIIYRANITEPKSTIDLSNQARGIYFWRVKGQKGFDSGKLVLE